MNALETRRLLELLPDLEVGDFMRYAKPRKYKKISRYGIYRQIIDNNNDTYTETINPTPVVESEDDIFHEILMEEENRLDIVSNKYYGTPELWWVIAMANDIIDPLFIRPGTIVRVPPITSLLKWKGALYGRV